MAAELREADAVRGVLRERSLEEVLRPETKEVLGITDLAS